MPVVQKVFRTVHAFMSTCTHVHSCKLPCDLKHREREKKAAKAAQTPFAATPHAQMVRGKHKDDCYVEVLYMYMYTYMYILVKAAI